MTAATVGSGANAMIPFESFDLKMCKNKSDFDSKYV
jgi:hypothetical protein